jgi:hypothetical protein
LRVRKSNQRSFKQSHEPDEFKEYIKGKVFLIGLVFYDSNKVLLEQYQTSGTAEELTDGGLLMLRRKDGSLFPIPYDKDSISKAEKGEYTERSTGFVITDPDFIISGEIEVKDPSNVEKIKRDGFVPVNL